MNLNPEYASKGVAGAGLGTGIAGLSLGVLNSMGGLAGLTGLFGNRSTAAQNDVLTALLTTEMMRGQSRPETCGENTPVTRYELTQAQTIAGKDAEIGLLKADKYTDQKLTEVTAYLMGQIKDLAAEVRKNKDEQTGVNMQQVAYNATNSATIGCVQSQVAALQGMTKLVIPNTSVCPGWGAVKVTPEIATTPAA
ncbi:MAG: hypothetical protein HDT35_01800 [Clostridiales bacterium]|nr:hypothetical protein [Clostridiales bacterium]